MYSLTNLSPADIQNILTGLRKGPMEAVEELVFSIRKQVMEQENERKVKESFEQVKNSGGQGIPSDMVPGLVFPIKPSASLDPYSPGAMFGGSVGGTVAAEG